MSEIGTPWKLRSDCDGNCTVGKGVGGRHVHSHAHTPRTRRPSEQPLPANGRATPPPLLNGPFATPRAPAGAPVAMPADAPSPRLTRRQRQSMLADTPAKQASMSKADMERLRRASDIDDPTRTDYTYSYSTTYRSKPPSPQWNNPKMSRTGLHGRPEDLHRSNSGSSDGADDVALLSTRPWNFWPCRRSPTANGPSTSSGGAPDRHRPSVLGSLISLLWNLSIFPIFRLYKYVSVTNRATARRRRRCCTLLWLLFIPLLLLGCLLYNSDKERPQEILHAYVLPMPMLLWSNARRLLTSGSAPQAVISPPGHGSNGYALLRADLARLEALVHALQEKLAAAPVGVDYSKFALRAELDALRTAQPGETSESLQLRVAAVELALAEPAAAIAALQARLSALDAVERGDAAAVEELRAEVAAARLAQASAVDALRAELAASADGSLAAVRAELEALRAAHDSGGKAVDARLAALAAAAAASAVGSSTSGVSSADAASLDGRIAAALAKYDADKTGMADFALESAGGSILSIRCSKTYNPNTRVESIFGIPLLYGAYSPRTVIQEGASPGACWAFRGAEGFLVVQLSGVVRVTAVSYEHIPRSLAPDAHIDSAPRRFDILGLQSENDPEPVLLGSYEFERDGPPLQTFQVEEAAPVPIVELKIRSNQGHPVYTCLYRLRVHGQRVSPVYGKP